MARRSVMLMVILLVAMSLDHAWAEDEIGPWDTIDTLRADGDFTGALAVARDLLAGYEATDGIPDSDVGDARREVATLAGLTRLGPADQAAMAEAARLELAIHDHYWSDEYTEAAAAARRFLELNRRHLGPRHHETADAAQLYALMLEELDQLAAADELYTLANDIYAEVFEPVHPGREALLNNWAFVLAKLWRREEEVARQRLALNMARELYADDPAYIGLSLNNLGVILMEIGRFGESHEMLSEALRIREAHGSVDDVLQARLNLANLSFERGTRERAREQLDLALTLITRDSTLAPHLVAATLKSDARLRIHDRDFAGAERGYRQALTMRREIWPERSIPVATMRIDVGAALAHLGRFKEADVEFAAGIQSLEEIQERGSPGLVWAYRLRADRFWLAGHHERAAEEYERAAQMYEEVRFKLGTWGSLDIYETPWFDYAASLLLCGREGEAWQALEAGQGRLLVDALRGRRHGGLEPEEAAALRRLTDEVTAARNQLTASPTTNHTDSESSDWFEDVVVRLRVATTALDSFHAELSCTIVAETGRSTGLVRVQTVLAPNEAIVGWLQVDAGEPTARAWGYVVRDTGPVRWVADLPLPRDPEQPSPARMCATAIREGQNWQHLADQTWRERIEPLLPYLDGVDALLVVPAGDILGVPVETLGPSDRGPLCDRYRISYVPSAAVLVSLRAQDANTVSTAPPRTLALGDPPFAPEHLQEMTHEEAGIVVAYENPPIRGDSGLDQLTPAQLPRLPMTRSEALAVTRLGGPGSVALVGPDCSEQRLAGFAASGELGDFEILHIATHAIIQSAAPRRSGLVLSQIGLPDATRERDETRHLDGIVTAQEIALDWNLNARLVALTGCETGLGRRQLGEGFLGFTNVFLMRGADAVLVSLWPIEDRSTELLVTRFYELYLGDRSGRRGKAACLQEAKAWLREFVDELSGERLYGHPRHWAGLVLVGNPD